MVHLGSSSSVCGLDSSSSTTLTSFAAASSSVLADYRLILHRKVNGMNPNSLPGVFRNPGSHNSSNFIITIQPSSANRLNFEKRIASEYVLKLLWGETHSPSDRRYGEVVRSIPGQPDFCPRRRVDLRAPDARVSREETNHSAVSRIWPQGEGGYPL